VFQVAQDRAVELAFALVINTQDADRRQGIGRRFTDAAQQGRRAMPVRVAKRAPGLPLSARAMA
jgi:hypothetical protein